MTKVIKVGGKILDDQESLAAFVNSIKNSAPNSLIIVHGGGQELSSWQRRLGIEPRFSKSSGVRITDADSLEVAKAVLRGVVGTRLVHALCQSGIMAIGMSGVDLGLVSARPMILADEELQFTGEVVAVNRENLEIILLAQFVPVIASLCFDDHGVLNVNADDVASAIASSLEVEQLVLLTEVPGVFIDGELCLAIHVGEIEGLVKAEAVTGGMIPKLRMAANAVSKGVKSVMICNQVGLANGQGTLVVP